MLTHVLLCQQVRMIMERCWTTEPQQRPSFISLIEKFEGMCRKREGNSCGNSSLAQVCWAQIWIYCIFVPPWNFIMLALFFYGSTFYIFYCRVYRHFQIQNLQKLTDCTHMMSVILYLNLFIFVFVTADASNQMSFCILLTLKCRRDGYCFLWIIQN